MKREAPRREPTRLGKCLRKFFRISFSNFGMLIIVFVYLIFGGFLFQFLENKKKIDSRAYFRRHRDECIQELWSVTKSSHVLYKQNWTLEALDPLRKFEANVIREMTSNHKFFVRTWSFTDSLFYSVTILTTIGYNNHTPNTSVGKIATIIYATFGIPLILLFICNVGFMLSDLLQFGHLYKTHLHFAGSNEVNSSDEKTVYEGPTIVKRDTVVSMNTNKANKCSNEIRHTVLNHSQTQRTPEDNLTRYGTIRLHDCSFCQQCNDFDVNCDWCRQDIRFRIKQPEITPTAKDHIIAEKMKKRYHNVCFPILFTFLILTSYICVGALVYSLWKDQPFADGAYFCFLTLTTIGSCDIFRNLFTATNETIALLLYSAYLFIGLTLTSAFVLLVQRNVKIESSSISLIRFQKRTDEVAL